MIWVLGELAELPDVLFLTKAMTLQGAMVSPHRGKFLVRTKYQIIKRRVNGFNLYSCSTTCSWNYPWLFFCFVWCFFLVSLTLFCLLQLKSEAAWMLEVWRLCRWKRALFETEKRSEWTGKCKAPVKRQEGGWPLNFRAEFICRFLVAAYAILILHLACINKKCNTLIVVLGSEIACLLGMVQWMS